MKRHYIKTVGTLIMIVAMVSLLLSACGGKAASKDPSSGSAASTAPAASAAPAAETAKEAAAENVKLTFWHTYGDAEEPVFNDSVISAFQEKYPNIQIEVLRQEGGQFNQLITTAFGTGQTPDVARVDIANIAAYAKQDGIIALDGMAEFNALKDQCLAGPLSTNLYKGKYYGLPLDTNCKAAVMNMNVMKKLGLSKAPATMEEFIDASKKVGGGKYTLNVSGVSDWDLFPYFWLFGGTVTDPGFTKATGYLDSPASIAALQKMLDLHKDKIFTIRDIDGTADAWDGIKTDKYAMFFEGPWYWSSNPDYKDKNIALAPIPTYNGKAATVVGGEDVAIFKNCQHQKEAFQFIQFLLSDEAQMIMAKVGQMPVLKSAVNNDQIKNDPVMSVYQKQLESAYTRIPSPQASAIVQIWSDEVTKAFQGKETAEAVLKTAAAKIDAELVK